jgi:hypothetical protein
MITNLPAAGTILKLKTTDHYLPFLPKLKMKSTLLFKASSSSDFSGKRAGIELLHPSKLSLLVGMPLRLR